MRTIDRFSTRLEIILHIIVRRNAGRTRSRTLAKAEQKHATHADNRQHGHRQLIAFCLVAAARNQSTIGMLTIAQRRDAD